MRIYLIGCLALLRLPHRSLLHAPCTGALAHMITPHGGGQVHELAVFDPPGKVGLPWLPG